MIDDIRTMMRAFKQKLPDTLGFPDQGTLDLRIALIDEELLELYEAVKHHDLIKTADAIIDLLVVTIGMGLALGLPLEALWDEVQRSNMSKVGPDGQVLKNLQGKVIKPGTYCAPRIKEILDNQ